MHLIWIDICSGIGLFGRRAITIHICSDFTLFRGGFVNWNFIRTKISLVFAPKPVQTPTTNYNGGWIKVCEVNSI